MENGLERPNVDVLSELEQVIERGLKTFVEVGEALGRIRDERLYKAEYDTFEEYCRERWQLSKARVYQLVNASQVNHNLSTTVDFLPQTESQTRPLALLEPEHQAEAWQQAVNNSNGQPTAKQVKQAVRQKPDKT